MNSVKVSVIVPVYNVSRYLENCVNSITDQDFTDFEIILVDDCSPDNSGEICDRLAKEDGRIRVIHKEKNGGISEARKTGLQAANGEWILFVDSDDRIEPGMLSYLLARADDCTDIVIFGVNFRHENKAGAEKYVNRVSPDDAEYQTPSEIGNLIAELDRLAILPYMWNKLYSADLLRKSEADFTRLQIMEDFYYNIQVLPNANRIVTVSKPFYNYRKTPGETLSSAYNPKFFELSKKRFLSEREALEKTGATTDNNMQIIYTSFVKHIITCIISDAGKKAGFSKKQRREHINLYLNDSLTKEVLEGFNPVSPKMKLIKKIFAGGSASAAAAFCKTVSFAQTKLGVIYNSILKK